MALERDSQGRKVDRVQVAGSNGEQDLQGEAVDRPDATTVPKGSTYWSLDTGVIEYTDGTTWKLVA